MSSADERLPHVPGLLWRILRLRLALLLERIAYRLAGRP
jgi:hypothetical protein